MSAFGISREVGNDRFVSERCLSHPWPLAASSNYSAGMVSLTKVWWVGPVRRVKGEVLKLRCGSCGGEFATFGFASDTDMVTADLATATAPATGEVVIGERLPDEMQNDLVGLARFADRISRERQVIFRPVPLLRAEQLVSQGSVSDFKVFRRSYSLPELVYGCPRCAGEAQVTRRETASEYAMQGGVISVVGRSLDRGA